MLAQGIRVKEQQNDGHFLSRTTTQRKAGRKCPDRESEGRDSKGKRKGATRRGSSANRKDRGAKTKTLKFGSKGQPAAGFTKQAGETLSRFGRKERQGRCYI